MTASTPAAGRIFISYRREETAYPAGWLFDRLVEHFGQGQVFKDVDSIQLGDDFVEVISAAVAGCDVLLALIGDEWLTITGEGGRRRLELVTAVTITVVLTSKTSQTSQTSNSAGPGHTGDVSSVAFSGDGTILASASYDDTVRLWNPATQKRIGPPLQGQRSQLMTVALSPDGKVVASGGYESTVQLWNTKTHKPIGQPLRGQDGRVNSVAFSPNGKLLASGGQDGTVRLWDTTTYRSTVSRNCGSPVLTVAFSHDGKIFACGTDAFEVLLWNTASHKQKGPTLPVCNGVVHGLAFSPVRNTLAIGCGNNIVRLWNPDTGDHIGKDM